MTDDTLEKPDDSISPDSVQTPAAVMAFLKLLDSQVADASTRSGDIVVAIGVRARGLHWALYRMAEIAAKQEARIAELERSTVKAVRVGMD